MFDMIDVIHMSKISNHYLLEYQTLLESYEMQAPNVTSGFRLDFSDDISDVDYTSDDWSLGECYSETSGELQCNRPEYSCFAGSKPLSLIIRRCNTPTIASSSSIPKTDDENSSDRSKYSCQSLQYKSTSSLLNVEPLADASNKLRNNCNIDVHTIVSKNNKAHVDDCMKGRINFNTSGPLSIKSKFIPLENANVFPLSGHNRDFPTNERNCSENVDSENKVELQNDSGCRISNLSAENKESDFINLPTSSEGASALKSYCDVRQNSFLQTHFSCVVEDTTSDIDKGLEKPYYGIKETPQDLSFRLPSDGLENHYASGQPLCNIQNLNCDIHSKIDSCVTGLISDVESEEKQESCRIGDHCAPNCASEKAEEDGSCNNKIVCEKSDLCEEVNTEGFEMNNDLSCVKLRKEINEGACVGLNSGLKNKVEAPPLSDSVHETSETSAVNFPEDIKELCSAVESEAPLSSPRVSEAVADALIQEIEKQTSVLMTSEEQEITSVDAVVVQQSQEVNGKLSCDTEGSFETKCSPSSSGMQMLLVHEEGIEAFSSSPKQQLSEVDKTMSPSAGALPENAFNAPKETPLKVLESVKKSLLKSPQISAEMSLCETSPFEECSVTVDACAAALSSSLIRCTHISSGALISSKKCESDLSLKQALPSEPSDAVLSSSKDSLFPTFPLGGVLPHELSASEDMPHALTSEEFVEHLPSGAEPVFPHLPGDASPILLPSEVPFRIASDSLCSSSRFEEHLAPSSSAESSSTFTVRSLHASTDCTPSLLAIESPNRSCKPLGASCSYDVNGRSLFPSAYQLNIVSSATATALRSASCALPCNTWGATLPFEELSLGAPLGSFPDAAEALDCEDLKNSRLLSCSPLLFSSDDESCSVTEEVSKGIERALAPSPPPPPPAPQLPPPVLPAGAVAVRAWEKARVRRLQELLTGAPPPPHITAPPCDVHGALQALRDRAPWAFKATACLAENGGSEAEKSCEIQDVREPAWCLEAASTAWPRVKNLTYPGIYYNRSCASEQLEALWQRLQVRCVSCETWSSVGAPGATVPSRPPKEGPATRRTGLSPCRSSRRLSHLARRQRLRAALPHVAPERRTILLHTATRRREAKQLKSSVKKQQLPRSGVSSKLLSSKRALFQSPSQEDLLPLPPRSTSASASSSARRALFTDQPQFLSCDPVGGSSAGRSSLSGCKKTRAASGGKKRKREESEGEGLRIPKRRLFTDDESISERLAQPLQAARQPKHKTTAKLSATHKKKLLWAVAEALKEKGVLLAHERFRPCATALAARLQRGPVQQLLAQRHQHGSSTSDSMLQLARMFAAEAMANT